MRMYTVAGGTGGHSDPKAETPKLLSSQEPGRDMSESFGSGAERGGFEPPKPVSQFNGLANTQSIDIKYLDSSDLGQREDAVTAQGQRAFIEPGLLVVMEAWSRLLEAIRVGIVAMVKTASGTRGST